MNGNTVIFSFASLPKGSTAGGKLDSLYKNLQKMWKCTYQLNSFTTRDKNTVKPILVATSIKQATCIKQASVQFP